MARAPFALIVLDGCGDNPNTDSNAVYHAKKPTLDQLRATAPWTHLVTYGEAVGLPEGQMGNSEVGHLNIGAGRVVEQELTRINRVIASGAIRTNPVFERLCEHSRNNPNAVLHIAGLVSTGGVHSSLEHLVGLLRALCEEGVPQVVIQVITDGRDRPPQAAVEEVSQLLDAISRLSAQHPSIRLEVGSVVGRYFAMDRDNRWERTAKAYDLWTRAVGEHFTDTRKALICKREAGGKDEFLEPLALAAASAKGRVTIEDGDSLLFFNFRADRLRQMVRAFTLSDTEFQGFQRATRPALDMFVTLTEYDAEFPVDVLFSPLHIKNHMGELLANHDIRQLRIAETEKYPHVTYFFNGGQEEPFPLETRVLVPSPRDVATYDLKPEMSAEQVTDKLVALIESGGFDVAIVNYANCDMVGHTGNFDAAVKAVETVDHCLGRVLRALSAVGGSAAITADHGNAEQMRDYVTGAPHTAHTMYLVPFFLFGPASTGVHLRSGGALCDIAPTMCDLLGIAKPAEMTGRSLLESK